MVKSESIIKQIYNGEVDGFLYPNIDTGSQRLRNLNKYSKMRLEYLRSIKPEMYRELLFAGKLVEHCEQLKE
ncbi:MAG: TnpV protein [Oscillospiraceae bacterium]